MDLGEILRVLRNRWRIMLPMMLLTAGLTAAAYVLVPTTYVSHSTVSLLSAERATTIGTQGNSNPFLTFDSSLVATADFLSRSLMSNESKQQLTQLGVTEEYTAGLADNAQGPFVTLTVTGDDSDHVLASTELLTQFAERKLREIQAGSGVKEQDMVRLTQILPPQTPDPKVKDKLEIVIGAAGVGTVAAFVLTFVVEGLVRSRRWANGPRPTVASAAARASVVPDQTLILPRVMPLEFADAATVHGKGLTGSGRAADMASGADADGVTSEESTELLLLGPLASAPAKPANGSAVGSSNGSSKGKGSGSGASNGSTWSTVYRSHGTTEQPRDADPAGQ